MSSCFAIIYVVVVNAMINAMRYSKNGVLFFASGNVRYSPVYLYLIQRKFCSLHTFTKYTVPRKSNTTVANK